MENNSKKLNILSNDILNTLLGLWTSNHEFQNKYELQVY